MLSFVSVDKYLTDKIRSNENHLFLKYLTQIAAASMFLESSRHNEVYNIVHSSYPEKKYVEKKKEWSNCWTKVLSSEWLCSLLGKWMIVSLAKSYAIDKIKTTFDFIEEIPSFFN